MVSVYPLLLFGGGQIGVDLSRGNFILSVDDGWIRFQAATHQVGIHSFAGLRSITMARQIFSQFFFPLIYVLKLREDLNRLSLFYLA